MLLALALTACGPTTCNGVDEAAAYLRARGIPNAECSASAQDEVLCATGSASYRCVVTNSTAPSGCGSSQIACERVPTLPETP